MSTKSMKASDTATGTVRIPVYLVEDSDHAMLLDAMLRERLDDRRRRDTYDVIEQCFFAALVGGWVALMHVFAFLYLAQG